MTLEELKLEVLKMRQKQKDAEGQIEGSVETEEFLGAHMVLQEEIYELDKKTVEKFTRQLIDEINKTKDEEEYTNSKYTLAYLTFFANYKMNEDVPEKDWVKDMVEKVSDTDWGNYVEYSRLSEENKKTLAMMFLQVEKEIYSKKIREELNLENFYIGISPFMKSIKSCLVSIVGPTSTFENGKCEREYRVKDANGKTCGFYGAEYDKTAYNTLVMNSRSAKVLYTYLGHCFADISCRKSFTGFVAKYNQEDVTEICDKSIKAFEKRIDKVNDNMDNLFQAVDKLEK